MCGGGKGGVARFPATAVFSASSGKPEFQQFYQTTKVMTNYFNEFPVISILHMGKPMYKG